MTARLPHLWGEDEGQGARPLLAVARQRRRRRRCEPPAGEGVSVTFAAGCGEPVLRASLSLTGGVGVYGLLLLLPLSLCLGRRFVSPRTLSSPSHQPLQVGLRSVVGWPR